MYFNDDYLENSYALAYDMGTYKGCYDCIVRLFDLIFDNDHLDKKKRIKYLSNIELDMLQNLMVECFSNKPKNEDESDIKYEEVKMKILELLR